MKKILCPLLAATFLLSPLAQADKEGPAASAVAILAGLSAIKYAPPLTSLTAEATNTGDNAGINLVSSQKGIYYNFTAATGSYATVKATVIGCVKLKGGKTGVIIGAEGHDAVDGQFTKGDIGVCQADKAGNLTAVFYTGGQSERYKEQIHRPLQQLNYLHITDLSLDTSSITRAYLGRVVDGTHDQFKMRTNTLLTHPYNAFRDKSLVFDRGFDWGVSERINHKVGQRAPYTTMGLQVDLEGVKSVGVSPNGESHPTSGTTSAISVYISHQVK